MGDRRKKWSGRYVIVWDDGTWEFFRCCRCGHLLDQKASRKRGLGPECVKHAPIDVVMVALSVDRKRYRQDIRSKEWVDFLGRRGPKPRR